MQSWGAASCQMLRSGGDFRSNEECCEDDVDEEPRQCVPLGVPFGSEVLADGGDPDQPDDAADHGSGEVEPLQERNGGPNQFAEHQQKTQSAK